MSRYHGKTGRIYVSVDASATAEPVVSMSAWSLALPRDRVDVTAFGDANKQKVQGLPDISGSFSGWFDDSEDALYTAADSSDGAKIYLYPDAENAPLAYWYGTAWIDISEVTAGVAEAVAVSASFEAAGAWQRIKG